MSIKAPETRTLDAAAARRALIQEGSALQARALVQRGVASALRNALPKLSPEARRIVDLEAKAADVLAEILDERGLAAMEYAGRLCTPAAQPPDRDVLAEAVTSVGEGQLLLAARQGSQPADRYGAARALCSALLSREGVTPEIAAELLRLLDKAGDDVPGLDDCRRALEESAGAAEGDLRGVLTGGEVLLCESAAAEPDGTCQRVADLLSAASYTDGRVQATCEAVIKALRMRAGEAAVRARLGDLKAVA